MSSRNGKGKRPKVARIDIYYRKTACTYSYSFTEDKPPPLSAPKTRVEATPDDKRVAMVWGVSETTRHMVRGLLRARGGWTFTRDARRPDVALQWAPLTEIVWDRGWPASPRAAHLSPPFPLQANTTRVAPCRLRTRILYSYHLPLSSQHLRHRHLHPPIFLHP